MTSRRNERARRSCLAVPGSNDRALAKARNLDADEIVIDLEDAVPPGAKDTARARVIAALESGEWRAEVLSVRVNGLDSPWLEADIDAVASCSAVDSIVVPKVEGAGTLSRIDSMLESADDGREREAPLGTQALIETARGLLESGSIAAGSERLETLIIGYADLGASLGRESKTTPMDWWLPAQETVLIAARANGLQAIDGPYLGTAVDEGFEAAAERGRSLGYDGKWAIHPSQVGRLTEVFTPSAERVERARAVLSALEAAAEQGRGAAALDGEMIDEATSAAARATLAKAGVVR